MILGALMALAVSQCTEPPYMRTQINGRCGFWETQSQVEFRINDQGNPENVGDVEFTAVENAIASWQTELTTCGSLSLIIGPRTSLRRVELLPDNNQNVVLWRFKSCAAVAPTNHACWTEESCGNLFDCWQHAGNVAALTTTSFEPSTGRILDSDIELDTPNFLFTTVDSPPCVPPNFHLGCVATDIQNTMTHELGHSLGLAHSCTPGSTMAETTDPGELGKRMLDPGSKLAMCEVYPKNGPSLRCGGGSGGGTGGAGGGGSVKPGCGCTTGADGAFALLGLLGWLMRRLQVRGAT